MNTPAMADDILPPERSGLPIEEVCELVEVGLLAMCATTPWRILVLRPLIRGRWAPRLRDDLGLQTPALAFPRLRRFEAAPSR